MSNNRDGYPFPKIDFVRASDLTPEIEEEIENAFEYHPWNGAQLSAGAKVRKALTDAVKVIVASVPPGPDRTTAIRKIREARMDCNSSITHEGAY